MSPLDKLEHLYHRAVKFPDPSARFHALRIAYGATENAIDHQAAQHRLRVKASMNSADLHPDDVEMEMYVLDTTTKELFPRVFRGGFLVSLWALYESGTKDLAEYTRRELKLPFGLQDLRAGDFLGQTEKYFRSTLQLEPYPDKAVRRRIEMVRDFRNTIAHHDGNLLEMPKSLLQAPTNSFHKYSDLHREFAMPTAEYNSESLDLLAKISAVLANSIYTKLHPKSSDA